MLINPLRLRILFSQLDPTQGVRMEIIVKFLVLVT